MATEEIRRHTMHGMDALIVTGCMYRQYSSALRRQTLFKSFPKPRPKRKGRAVRRDKSVAQAARDRDGTCLYGLLYQDGCVGMLAPHHIVSFGSDPRQDVLENLIVLCKKHHNQAEAHTIPSITLQGVLYHFYGYGPDEHKLVILDDMRKTAAEQGLTSVFKISPEIVEIKSVGFTSRFRRRYAWDFMESPEFRQTFEAEIGIAQRLFHG